MFEKVFNNEFITKMFNSGIVIIVSLILYNILIKLINNRKGKFMISSKSETYIRMMSSALRYVFLIITVLIVLQLNGVNVSGMLAGLGIASVVIGLAIQDALKDIIRGFSILSDDYFKVGDVIKYGRYEGKVIVIGLKTTKIKSIIDQNVISIANRNIEQVEVVSRQLDIEVPLSFEMSKTDAENIVQKCLDNIRENVKIDKCEYRGINNLKESNMGYLIRIWCNPVTKPQTRRDSICQIIKTLEENNIEIPYNQIDIHTK